MFKRISIFLYGVVSYGIFFGTFLYALGFVGNFVVPVTMDGTPSLASGRALLIDVLLLGIFALQHSVMARPFFKRWLTRFIPEPAERSTYVLLSSLALIAMFIFWQPLGGMAWSGTWTDRAQEATAGPGAQLELSFLARDIYLVLGGHDHDYERFAPMDANGVPGPTGIPSFVVGTGGDSYYRIHEPISGMEVGITSSPGVLELTLTPDGFEWAFRTVAQDPAGTLADSGGAQCRTSDASNTQ